MQIRPIRILIPESNAGQEGEVRRHPIAHGCVLDDGRRAITERCQLLKASARLAELVEFGDIATHTERSEVSELT